jgi:hypothetical protein
MEFPMKASILISAIALLSLGGCATCQNHPVYCAVGSAIIVGSVAATIAANSSDHDSGTRQIVQHIHGAQ